MTPIQGAGVGTAARVHFQDLLERERARHVAHLEDLQAPGRPGAGDLDGPLALQRRIADLVSAERRLARIARALGRVEQDTYGICQRCDTPIDAAWLEHRPWAECCRTHDAGVAA